MRLNFESEYKQTGNLAPHDLSEGLLICNNEVNKLGRASLWFMGESNLHLKFRKLSFYPLN